MRPLSVPEGVDAVGIIVSKATKLSMNPYTKAQLLALFEGCTSTTTGPNAGVASQINIYTRDFASGTREYIERALGNTSYGANNVGDVIKTPATMTTIMGNGTTWLPPMAPPAIPPARLTRPPSRICM